MGDNRKSLIDITCSFVIPVYNNTNYLDCCIRSIYGSCYSCSFNTEIIIIDDGSTDKSSEEIDDRLVKAVCRKYDDIGFPKVKIIIAHTLNRGVSSARNTGLRISRGEYVVFVDSDDMLDSEKMQKCINIILADSSIDMLIFGMSFDYYQKGECYRSTKLIPPYSGIKSIQECCNNIDLLFDTNSLSSLCNKIIKREMMNDIYLCESLSAYEDLEFSLRILDRCRNIYFYNEPLYHYRQSETEGNSINRLKGVKSVRFIVDRIEAALMCITDDEEHILSSVYTYLAMEKIKSSKKSHIKTVCEEYRLWIDSKGYENKSELLYSGNVNRIIVFLLLSKVRHYVANTAKKILHCR